MLEEIRWRFKPGAPLLVAHPSVADLKALVARVAQGNAICGCRDVPGFRPAAPEPAARARDAAGRRAILREAGFSDVQMFPVGFALGVACA